MKYIFSVLIALFACSAMAQLPPHLEGKVSYPVLDQQPWIGVIDIENDALTYDETVDYQVMVDVYDRMKEPSETFSGISETARTYNLLVAHGVPQEKIQMAVIVHGGSVDAFLSNKAYNEKFGQDNPNLVLIEALHDQGVIFYVCSQSLGFLNIQNEELCSAMDVALSARTSMIILDHKGYTYLNVSD